MLPPDDPHKLPLPTAGLAGQMSFTFYWAHHFRAAAGWTIPPPLQRPYATLWLILDGELHVEADGETCDCGPGHVVAWPPEALRSAENRTGRPVILHTAAFNLNLWGELDFFRFYRVPALYRAADMQELAEPFAALVAELAAHDEAVTLVAEGWARVLVGRWLSHLEAEGLLLPAGGVDERLREVLAAIDADLAGEWSLQRLADLMRLSKVRMREVFAGATGSPPMRYIMLRRIARARALLLDTELTCTEIAQRCGFQDPAYFSRTFHRVTGMQPLACREQAGFRRE